MDQITDPRATPSSRAAAPRLITLLGATGSIGRSTAEVLEAAPDSFRVVAVAGGRDAGALARMAVRLKARFAALADPAGFAELKEALAGTGIDAAAGEEAVVEAALHESDLVIGAISGTAGVKPTYAALVAGRAIALANKECLVCAGSAFMQAAALRGIRLLPVDSEHNAIFQALGEEDPATLDKMILTASGGPFRTWTRERIAAATPAEALAHPNWAMGPKVTVDSAGLMNKGLELIEARYLFAVEADRLDVLVHPQSIVHGLVSFADGSVTAGLAAPDMKVPIGHCLNYPARAATPARRLDLAAVGTLTFEKPDLDRFPALRLAFDVLRQGQGLPTVLNAANEIAVDAFLKGRIPFGRISPLVERACERALADGTAREPQSVAEALAVDHVVRESCRATMGDLDVSGA